MYGLFAEFIVQSMLAEIFMILGPFFFFFFF